MKEINIENSKQDLEPLPLREKLALTHLIDLALAYRDGIPDPVHAYESAEILKRLEITLTSDEQEQAMGLWGAKRDWVEALKGI